MSMKLKWVSLATCVLLFLASLLLWNVESIDDTVALGSGESVGTDRLSEGMGSRSPAGSSPDASDPGSTRRVPLEVGGTASLEMEVVDEEGKPLGGRIDWAVFREPPLSIGMAFEIGQSDSGSRKHEGRLTIRVPGGHWIWLRVTGKASRFGELTSFRRVAPFTGVQKERVQFRAGLRRIHVFLLSNDLRSPVRGGKVLLYRSPLKQIAAPRLVREVRTDPYGYASFDHLEPGLFSICSPGSQPKDPPPATARQILPASMPVLESFVTLVAPEASSRLHLTVKGVFTRNHDRPVKLVARRLTDRVDELYPLPGFLGAETEVFEQDFHLDLPDGEYEFQVLPLGTAWIEEGGKRIRIEGDTRHSFGLLANPDRCDLKIAGPTGYALPVTVAPLALVGEMEPEPGIQYLGPYRWRESRYSLPRLQEARRLVALGRMSSWISKEIVRVDTKEAQANFVPATRVEVRWAQGLESDDGSVIVEVTSAFETRRARLRPRLRAGSGRDGRTLVATFVVPRGSMTVLLRTSEGRVLWTQTLQARQPNQVLEVKTP